jgi:hypothetical protein
MNAFAARRSPFTGFGVRSSEFRVPPKSAIRNPQSEILTPELLNSGFYILAPVVHYCRRQVPVWSPALTTDVAHFPR